MKPGIYPDITDDDYHADEGVSKSMLWTLHTKTPAHLKYGRRVESAAFDIGKATHCAILEPHRFEDSWMMGPTDRRGNKWTEALEASRVDGKALLTMPEYETVLRMRDHVGRDPLISALTGPTSKVEHSAYWNNGGTLCKCRPDLYQPETKIILDLKTTQDASAAAFAKSCASYGYHAQQAWYQPGWTLAGGGEVENFLFLAVEKAPPYAYAIYELDAEAVCEGEIAMQRALSQYISCQANAYWPGYPQPVQPLSLPKWAFKNEDMPL